MMKMMMT